MGWVMSHKSHLGPACGAGTETDACSQRIRCRRTLNIYRWFSVCTICTVRRLFGGNSDSVLQRALRSNIEGYPSTEASAELTRYNVADIFAILSDISHHFLSGNADEDKTWTMSLVWPMSHGLYRVGQDGPAKKKMITPRKMGKYLG